MTGILYVVGVGPGDPELLTLKAARIIQNADLIAYPSKGDGTGTAYEIARLAIPGLFQKEKLPLKFPMVTSDLSKEHLTIANQIQEILQKGKNVAFLTLGDPGFYSTAYHFLDILLQNDYPVEIVSGVTSFSAVSARLQIPLAMGEESVLITSGEVRDFEGTQVILKAGSRLNILKDKIRSLGKTAFLIENCGMENEKIHSGIEDLPTEAGYFSILLVRDYSNEP